MAIAAFRVPSLNAIRPRACGRRGRAAKGNHRLEHEIAAEFAAEKLGRIDERRVLVARKQLEHADKVARQENDRQRKERDVGRVEDDDERGAKVAADAKPDGALDVGGHCPRIRPAGKQKRTKLD